jgi:hypothetical protein
MLLKRLDSHLSSILLVSLGPDCTRTKVMLGAEHQECLLLHGCGRLAHTTMIYTHTRQGFVGPAARTVKDYDKSRAGIERYALTAEPDERVVLGTLCARLEYKI